MDKYFFLYELQSSGIFIKDAEFENPNNVLLHNILDTILRLRYLGYPIFEEDFEMYSDDEAMLSGDYLYNN